MIKLPLKNNLRIGDCFLILMSVLLIIFLFQKLWSRSPAHKLIITQANKTVGTYDLNQVKNIAIHGRQGESLVWIENGKAKFKRSSCNNQYCVRQGWLSQAGQSAICLPNQVSIRLTGEGDNYDSLSY